MAGEDLKAMLDRLADWQEERNSRTAKYMELIDSLIPPDVKEKMKEIEAEFANDNLSSDQNIVNLEKQIKDLVKAGGLSVKGSKLHAVFNKGRVTWDGSKLDGLMIAIPQLKEARKEGEPSVTIRSVKEKE